MSANQQLRDRYPDKVGTKRDFKTALIRLLETDYKVLGSRRVLVMLTDDIESRLGGTSRILSAAEPITEWRPRVADDEG